MALFGCLLLRLEYLYDVRALTNLVAPNLPADPTTNSFLQAKHYVRSTAADPYIFGMKNYTFEFYVQIYFVIFSSKKLALEK